MKLWRLVYSVLGYDVIHNVGLSAVHIWRDCFALITITTFSVKAVLRRLVCEYRLRKTVAGSESKTRKGFDMKVTGLTSFKYGAALRTLLHRLGRQHGKMRGHDVYKIVYAKPLRNLHNSPGITRIGQISIPRTSSYFPRVFARSNQVNSAPSKS